MRRRLLITVCPRECGVVSLRVDRGRRAERLGAVAIAARLEAVIKRRGLESRVEVQQACAGGCRGDGPNVSVTLYPMPRPGERPDHVATGWRTYVGSLDTLPCLASVIDENLDDARSRKRPDRSARR